MREPGQCACSGGDGCHTLSMPLMLARQIEQQACQLARDAKTLVHWLAHVILALAGRGLVDRQGLFDFVVAELQHREHLDPPRIRPVRRALEKQRDDLLAFAGVLDHELACIARDCDVPRYLVRDLCLLQRKSPSSSAYWQRWNLLHKKLAGKSQRGADAVVDANGTILAPVHSSKTSTRGCATIFSSAVNWAHLISTYCSSSSITAPSFRSHRP